MSASPSRPGELHPEPLTDPDLTLSRHPARAIARRLRLPLNIGILPLPVDPISTAMACPLRSTGITPLHHYKETGSPGSTPLAGEGRFISLWVGKADGELLRGSPPLIEASILSASWFVPLVPCMGSRLSSGSRATNFLAFLIGFFVRPESPFLRPDPQYCKAGARRSCQGWPSHQPFHALC